MEAHIGLPAWKLSIHGQISGDFALPSPIPASSGNLTTLTVILDNAAPEPEELQIGFNESYTIEVTTSGATLRAPSVWGLIRGMETFSQLLDWDGSAYYILRVPLTISDAPRFAWRGFMVDTARHYLPVDTVRHILDLMAAFKFSVLHWHMVDAQSFPFVSAAYPELSKKGAFGSEAVYTAAAIRGLVQYARERAIVVIPELDFPGHTASWGMGYPGVTVDCWDWIGKDRMYYAENVVGLNPANPDAHTMAKTLLSELADLFPAKYVHIGGDEVNTACWNRSKQAGDIQAYMAAQGLTSLREIQSVIVREAQAHLTQAKGRTPIVWEESLGLPGSPIENDTIVQVWKERDSLKAAIQAGHRVVLSEGFYQDMQAPMCTMVTADQPECRQDARYWLYIWTWLDMYNNDPTRGMGFTPEEEKRVLGGEACSWGESEDAQNYDGRSFSRSPAVAERLWSSIDMHADPVAKHKAERAFFENRLLRLRCTLVRRGISQAAPLAPDYCPTRTSDPPAVPSVAPVPPNNTALLIAVGCLGVVAAVTSVMAVVFGVLHFRNRKILDTYSQITASLGSPQ
eukprot:GAFH01001051.1.p1 GENE.GAFH01001051.1~~GAFH01001051.1.p1  ORF type:complete len:646 (+),score=218.50 GAFH01001051.1:226-1938(+)